MSSFRRSPTVIFFFSPLLEKHLDISQDNILIGYQLKALVLLMMFTFVSGRQDWLFILSTSFSIELSLMRRE